MRTPVLSLLASFLLVSRMAFGAGEDNPTGVSGMFTTVVNTGCSYYPYTGNAVRAVTDIVVNGAVGAYPLTFTRYMNSRGGSGVPFPFGLAGSWTHNWQWSIDTYYLSGQRNFNGLPNYTVRYPDGRVVTFTTANRNGDPDYHGALGVTDRMEPVPGGGNSVDPYTTDCYLRMADGGRVHFSATRSEALGPDGGPYSYNWSFQVLEIIDPYGQATQITLSADGTSGTITEHAGRTLTITSRAGPAGGTVIDKVTSSDGRIVTYNYTATNYGGTNYNCLTSITNYDNSTATYTYQASNTSANGRPLIQTCVDPMYPGPMWRIAYSYNGSTVYGQIWKELYYDGTRPVSTLAISGSTRTETRGDGPQRTFTYSTYKVTGITDFNGISSTIAYDTGGFPNGVTDFNGNTTNFTNNSYNGALLTTTYPLTPSDTANGWGRATSSNVFGSSTCPDPNNRDGNNPYYLYSTSNEPRRHHKRGFGATYLRDSSKRVTTITYLDSGTETFAYDLTNGITYNQVVSHQLKSGGTETFEYDTRRRLLRYRDPYHQSPATASLTYAYYESGPNTDLVYTVTNARGNVTTFTYNARGQVLTKAINGTTFVTNTYNTNGTLATVTDERGKVTSYTYDDYKRLRTVTLPPSPGNTATASTVAYKHDFTNADDYTHTDANPWLAVSPAGVTTNIVYDNNNRKTSLTLAPAGNSDPGFDKAKTTFTYDNNGNLKTVKDPNNNYSGGSLVTQYYYDQQNRVTDVDDRMVGDPTVPHKNSNNHTVS